MTSNAARRQQAAARRQQSVGTSSGAPVSRAHSVHAMWRLRGPDGSIAVGWYLLPLRLFLGVTFLFAGLQKLSNPNFFRVADPGSIHAQMAGAARTSPIGALLGHLVGLAPWIGAVIALGELAIGVGALLGLLTRVAAVGGVLLSFSLFLAISFHTSPYYTGADIVFVFAWTPIVLAGAAGAPALDTWFATRDARSPVATDGSDDAVPRGAVIAMVAGAAAVLAAAVTGLGRAAASTKTTGSAATLPPATTPPPTAAVTSTTSPGTPTTAPSATSTTTALPKGTSIGAASGVPVGGSASFNDPSTGDPSLVIQQTAGQFVAFDAICPHAGCTVAYQSAANIIACPCHGSEFDARTGDVIQGPATYGLTPIKIVKGSNGNLYVV